MNQAFFDLSGQTAQILFDTNLIQLEINSDDLNAYRKKHDISYFTEAIRCLLNCDITCSRDTLSSSNFDFS